MKTIAEIMMTLRVRVESVACVLLISALVGAAGGCKQPEKAPNRTERIGGKSLSETIEDNRHRLLSIPGVVEIEAGMCGVDSCIKVLVEKKTAMIETQIPLMLETWPVEVTESAR